VLCPDSLRLQAYFDGELDALTAAEIERHMEHCPQCAELYRSLESARAGLRRDLPYFRVPASLAARLSSALDQVGVPGSSSATLRPAAGWRPRPFWMGALSGVGGSAIAAALMFFILLPSPGNPLIEDLLGAHLRSLMPTHLIDVTSSDKHTVKPWFAGHADVSPSVADFQPQGYKLVGGRADYVAHQRSAVVVYQHGAHIINVFSWAVGARDLSDTVTRNGYHLVFWTQGDLEYCAVSDTSRAELIGLERLIQGIGVEDPQR
jgi:anti-sigma factor RsiW